MDNLLRLLRLSVFDVSKRGVNIAYRVVPGSRNWQVETADWNLDVHLET